jgi:hypothetical protein
VLSGDRRVHYHPQNGDRRDRPPDSRNSRHKD